MYEELNKRGVRVFKHFKFEKWQLNKDNTKIKKVTFESKNRRMTFTCGGLFWFDRKIISEVNGQSKFFSSFFFFFFIHDPYEKGLRLYVSKCENLTHG